MKVFFTMFSLFKIMLTISYTTTVTLICLSVAKNVIDKTFQLVNLGRPFLRRMRF